MSVFNTDSFQALGSLKGYQNHAVILLEKRWRVNTWREWF